MGQVLHGSATTEAIRRGIQHGEASLRAPAKRYEINQGTVAKWKGRTSVADAPTGPKEPRSTVLSVEDEAIVVAFRRHTLPLLDDCLYALQPTPSHHRWTKRRTSENQRPEPSLGWCQGMVIGRPRRGPTRNMSRAHLSRAGQPTF